MKIEAVDFAEYLAQIPEDRKEAFAKLREVINQHLPPGFEETILYGMPTWVVPKSIYPAGYHCDPKLPLYFTSIASQKGSVNWYANFGGDESLGEWLIAEYSKTGKKLDMGKSCVRFKRVQDIPFDLIAHVVSKTTVDQWVSYYESVVRR